MKKQLKFNKDGKFRILCFGDLHEDNNFDTPNDCKKFEDMQLLMKTAVKKYKPDLAVFMGDTYCSNENVDEMITKIVKPITDADIPFAAVLGNHEHDRDVEPLLNAYFNNPHCLCFNDDPNITGDMNYNLTIQASDSDKINKLLGELNENVNLLGPIRFHYGVHTKIGKNTGIKRSNFFALKEMLCKLIRVHACELPELQHRLHRR